MCISFSHISSVIYDFGQFHPVFPVNRGEVANAAFISKGSEVASVSLLGPTAIAFVAVVLLFF